jgi:hypothetical protein
VNVQTHMIRVTKCPWKVFHETYTMELKLQRNVRRSNNSRTITNTEIDLNAVRSVNHKWRNILKSDHHYENSNPRKWLSINVSQNKRDVDPNILK